MRSGAVHCNRLVALLLLIGGAAAFLQGAHASTVTFVDPNLEDAVRTAIVLMSLFGLGPVIGVVYLVALVPRLSRDDGYASGGFEKRY